YFSTGNHEYYSGVDEWLQYLPSLGIRPLSNERVQIAPGLDIAGIHDPTGRGRYAPDLGRALDGRDARTPVVPLAHQAPQVRAAGGGAPSIKTNRGWASRRRSFSASSRTPMTLAAAPFVRRPSSGSPRSSAAALVAAATTSTLESPACASSASSCASIPGAVPSFPRSVP